MTSLQRKRAAPATALAALLIVAVALGALAATAALASDGAKLDLNSATLAQIQALPISADLAQRIYDYRTYERYFDNVYDLMDVDGMTAADLELLKPLVETLPPPAADAALIRLEASYRQVRQFLGQEGTNEGLVDEYLDQLRDPVNVNRLDLFDLMSYQNVSPIDATNIIKARKRLGGFSDARQLRQAEGLLYYSFRNLRDFVTYTDPDSAALAGGRVHGSYQVRYYDTPYSTDDTDVIAVNNGVLFSDRGPAPEFATPSYALGMPLPQPAMMHKLRFDLGGGFKAGLLTNRNVGERSWDETVKGFYGVQDKTFGGFHLKRLIFGNYRVAFGQGLIMDNTDYNLPRKTGFAWNVRPIGVRPDLSRSREFALTGAAAEGVYGRLLTTAFWSTGRKDGILNPDGTVNSYVVMDPRPSADFLDHHVTQASAPTGLKRNAFREDIIGGNVKFMVNDGTYVGLTGYEARYDRAFNANVDPTVLFVNPSYLSGRDSEIFAGYTSVADSGRTLHKFRRVYGAEFQTVFANVSLQGEYGVQQDPDRPLFRGSNKDAFLINGYAQWSDLNLLAIYRDYDVGYDNPYNRGFANDNRYAQTLFDSPYRAQDDLYSYLAITTPQPKPERGLFVSTRYRISRALTITGLEYDQWKRVADGTDARRYTLKAEYQPIFNLRLRVRHRYSSRSEMDPFDVRAYRSWETRWELLALLSHYNSLKLLYLSANTMFPPRARLSYPVDIGSLSAVGTAAIPAHVFAAGYEHNLSPHIRLLLATEMYDGFFWNFEGDEFVTVDGRGFRNWAQLESRISDNLLWRLKVTRDHNLPHTWVVPRDYGNTGATPNVGPPYEPKDVTSVRMQLDCTF